MLPPAQPRRLDLDSDHVNERDLFGAPAQVKGEEESSTPRNGREVGEWNKNGKRRKLANCLERPDGGALSLFFSGICTSWLAEILLRQRHAARGARSISIGFACARIAGSSQLACADVPFGQRTAVSVWRSRPRDLVQLLNAENGFESVRRILL